MQPKVEVSAGSRMTGKSRHRRDEHAIFSPSPYKLETILSHSSGMSIGFGTHAAQIHILAVSYELSGFGKITPRSETPFLCTRGGAGLPKGPEGAGPAEPWVHAGRKALPWVVTSTHDLVPHTSSLK